MLQLSNELLTDDTLHKLFQTMTLNPSILLLEDIDAASDLVKMREGTVEAMVLSEVASVVSSEELSSHEDENLTEEPGLPDTLTSGSHREQETKRDETVCKWEGDTDTITPEAMHKRGMRPKLKMIFCFLRIIHGASVGMSKLEMVVMFLMGVAASMATIVVVNKHR